MHRSCKRRGECGSGMLDALVGVFISVIVGAGTMHVAARISKSQHDLRIEGVAVAQLRTMLALQGSVLCGASGKSVTLPNGHVAAIQAFNCGTAEKITVRPSLNDAAAPTTLQIDAVPSITATVRLSTLGLNANVANAEIEVGTRL